MSRFSHAHGFSIVQICVVMVLIGIFFMLSLKGGAAIEAIKANLVMSQLPRLQYMIQTYREEFRELPGDGPWSRSKWGRESALTRFPSGELASLEGNSNIDGHLYDVGNPNGEQFAAWRDLRAAGFFEGDKNQIGGSAMPENPFGGFYGFDGGNLGQKAGSLCATKIPGRAAESIDTRLDDGRINTGRLVATSKFSIEENNHFDAPDTEPYNVEKEYIICVPILP
jgi:hypothetical protein